MSHASEWSTQKFQRVIGVVLVIAFIMFGALYRASSQGDYSDTYPKGFRGGACTIETEMLTIGYSGYYLPQDYTVSGDSLRSAHVPIQCGRVPEPASLNISIDLLYPDSAREIPLSLSLVQLKMDEKENQEEHEVLSVPAQSHPSGVITLAFKLDQPGQYILYLKGESAASLNLQVKIPLMVGLEWRDHLRKNFSTFLKNH